MRHSSGLPLELPTQPRRGHETAWPQRNRAPAPAVGIRDRGLPQTSLGRRLCRSCVREKTHGIF